MNAYSERPELVSRLSAERVSLIEGAAGYGKSRLAAELRESLGMVSVNVQLDRCRAEPANLVNELARAVRRAKLTHLAPVTTLVRDADDVFDDLLEALGARTEPVLFSIDDAQALDDADRRLLMRFAAELPRPHRLLIVKRGLGDLCRYLRPEKPVSCISSTDLQLTEENIRSIFEQASAPALGQHELKMILGVTAGWPIAVARLAHSTALPPSEASALDVVATLLREQLAELDPASQRIVPQLAHLPWLSKEIVDEVTGIAGLFDEMAEAGLPMLEEQALRVVFPGPVRDHLASLGTFRPSIATKAASEYVSLGAIDAAVGVLLAAGRSSAAAKLLAELPPFRVEHLSYVELKTSSDLLATEAVRAHPRVLLHLARRAELALDPRTRSRALRRVEKIAADRADKPLLREIWAERARDMVRDNLIHEAETLASQTLREAGPDELRARARSLETLARVRAHDMWDSASVKAAESKFVEADVLARWAGETTWAAQALHALAWNVHFARGEIDAMTERLTEALGLVQGANRFRAVVLIARARGLIYVGRYPEAEKDLEEAEQLGNMLRDECILAETALERARIASQACDPSTTIAHLTEAERHLGAANGDADRVGFFTDAAVLLGRIGETEAAQDFITRARAETDADENPIIVAKGLLLARSGDPAQAEDRFEEIEAGLLYPPRERWRVSLFRAYAAERRGDPSATAWAATAFDAADALGLPLVPLVQEHALAQRLVAAAAGAGSRAAASLPVENLPLTVYVLGRFAVVRGGLEVPLPSGRPQKLVKFLAARGGRAHVEEAVEALWPNVSPGSGRKRLRNVLSRLRETCSELVVRQGEILSIAERVEVDAHLFERDARKALGDGPNGNGNGDTVATARSAVARYAGELLPDDLYEPWAGGPRERLRLRCLSLLDLLAAASRANGNSQEELVALERAMEVDPDDAGRYFAAAESLRAQGKRLAAYSMLLRARSALTAAGLPAPRAFVDLAEELRNDVAQGNDPVISR
jgi:ATP/maltotriose-dependent transcriptional regulator MalT/DNA-binding SARP family transcriptional activator